MTTQADELQATVAPHVPELSHVWTPWPEHRVAPGTQLPWHAPVTQA